jgi:hypothetical protein
MHHIEPGHDRVVLLLAPGKDDVFVVVAEDGVEHWGVSCSQGRTTIAPADKGAGKKISRSSPQSRPAGFKTMEATGCQTVFNRII